MTSLFWLTAPEKAVVVEDYSPRLDSPRFCRWRLLWRSAIHADSSASCSSCSRDAGARRALDEDGGLVFGEENVRANQRGARGELRGETRDCFVRTSDLSPLTWIRRCRRKRRLIRCSSERTILSGVVFLPRMRLMLHERRSFMSRSLFTRPHLLLLSIQWARRTGAGRREETLAMARLASAIRRG